MKQHSFEYYALQYLLMWQQIDRPIHDSMQKGISHENVRMVLSKYRVARSFKDVAKIEKSGAILTALNEMSDMESELPAERVKILVSKLSVPFGRNNLSAATKLLWFRYRHPFVILDSLAVATLKQLNPKFNPLEYSEFEAVWRDEYNKCKDKIASAVARLPELQPFFSKWHDSPTSIESTVCEPWFSERVFDVYLWETGRDLLDKMYGKNPTTQIDPS